jgi:hypothetical protein
MASKEWHLRASWSLDKLATEMATHYGYADRTALLKSMIRLGAMLGQESPVHKALHMIAEETPMLQDKTDAELLRRWNANVPGIFVQLRKAVDEVSRALGGSAVEELLATVTREAIRRVKTCPQTCATHPKRNRQTSALSKHYIA